MDKPQTIKGTFTLIKNEIYTDKQRLLNNGPQQPVAPAVTVLCSKPQPTVIARPSHCQNRIDCLSVGNRQLASGTCKAPFDFPVTFPVTEMNFRQFNSRFMPLRSIDLFTKQEAVALPSPAM